MGRRRHHTSSLSPLFSRTGLISGKGMGSPGPELTPRTELPQDLQEALDRCPGLDESFLLEGRQNFKAKKKHAQRKRSRVRKKDPVLVEEKIIADYSRTAEQSGQCSALNEGKAEELPYLPPELWTDIFGRTNLTMCLGLRDFAAAHMILHSKYRRQLALKHCVAIRKANDLQLLVFTMKIISPRDLLLLTASSLDECVRLRKRRKRDEDFIWLVKFGLGEWFGQNILTILKALVEVGRAEIFRKLLKAIPISDEDLEELMSFVREVKHRNSGNDSDQNWGSDIESIYSQCLTAQIHAMDLENEMYILFAYSWPYMGLTKYTHMCLC